MEVGQGAIASLARGWLHLANNPSAMDQLLAMGFPEETARAALEAHGNDLTRSLDALLSGEPASTHASSPVVSGSAVSNIRLYVRSIPDYLPIPGTGVEYSLYASV